MSTLTYGFVRVASGKHRGVVGYYDDDKSESLAIVYLGAPCLSPYVVLWKRSLTPISSADAVRLGWRNEVQLAVS